MLPEKVRGYQLLKKFPAFMGPEDVYCIYKHPYNGYPRTKMPGLPNLFLRVCTLKQ